MPSHFILKLMHKIIYTEKFQSEQQVHFISKISQIQS
jgi:hypothetical protein